MLIRRGLLVLITLLAAAASAWSQPEAEAPRIWRVCVGDSAIPPYVNNDPRSLGRAERLMVATGKSVGVHVLLQRYPFRRCRNMLHSGDTDMMFAGPAPENLRELLFPMKNGAVDTDKRVAQLNLVWVRRPESKIDWDGRQIVGETMGKIPRVGVRAGLRVAINAVSQLNLDIDETALNVKLQMRMLSAGRFDLALGLQEEVEMVLSEPDSKPLVVLPKALVRQDFYVTVSPKMPAPSQAIAERIWVAIGKMRDLPEFQRD